MMVLTQQTRDVDSMLGQRWRRWTNIKPILGQHLVFARYVTRVLFYPYWSVLTDRQTNILLTEIKVITDLFVIVIRDIYVHVYTRMLVC